MLNAILEHLSVLGVALGFCGLGYSVWLASGVRRTTKTASKWSWKRFWSDVFTLACWIYALAASSVALDVLNWLIATFDLPEVAAAISGLDSLAIVALPLTLGVNYFIKGLTNLKNTAALPVAEKEEK